jgi:glutathione peroxidase
MTDIYKIKINSLQNKAIDLTEYNNKYILFANVASKCGFTSQYKELEELYKMYEDTLMIVGSPCNQFGNQEPGTAEDIEAFCKVNFGVTFLMTEKIDVKGSKQHPLYSWLTDKTLNNSKSSTVKWNFQKYLVSPEGQLVDYYFSLTKPSSSKITKHLI